MSPIFRLATLAIMFILLAASPRAESLMTGSVLSLNGVTLTVTGCSVVLGVTQANCNAGDYNFTAVSFDGGSGFEVTSNVANQPCCDDLLETNNLVFTLSVTAARGTSISSAAAVTTASGNIFTNPYSLFGITNFVSSVTDPSGTASIATNYYNPSQALTLSPDQTLAVSNTIALNAMTGVNSLGLWDVEEVFVPAPEPPTFAVMAIGLLSTLMIHRWRRRRRDCQHPI